MTKSNQPQKNKKQLQLLPEDILALFISLGYLQSVLTVAHHASFWVHDGSTHTVESPSLPLLILSSVLVLYRWKKSKQASPGILGIISLTILIISSIFWLSGLRTNFYF